MWLVDQIPDSFPFPCSSSRYRPAQVFNLLPRFRVVRVQIQSPFHPHERSREVAGADTTNAEVKRCFCATFSGEFREQRYSCLGAFLLHQQLPVNKAMWMCGWVRVDLRASRYYVTRPPEVFSLATAGITTILCQRGAIFFSYCVSASTHRRLCLDLATCRAVSPSLLRNAGSAPYLISSSTTS